MRLNIKCQVIITVEHRQCVSELMRHPCSSNILPYLSKFPTWDDLTTFSIRSQNLHLTFCLPLSPSPFWVSNCPTVHKRQREKRDYDPPPNVISTPPCVGGGRCREGVGLLKGFNVVLLHWAPWNFLKWTAIQEHPFLQFIPQCSHWGSVYKIKTGSLSRTFALSATPFEVKHNLGTVSGIKKVVNQSVCLKTEVKKEIRRGCQK